MKNKKSLFFMFLIALVGITIGGTLAFYTTTDTYDNTFSAGTYDVEMIEAFVSPDNWTPGTTTPKTVTVTNHGTVPAAVRVKLTPSWVDANGDPLPLTDNDNNEAAIINFADNVIRRWTYQDGYYYYNGAINEGESTTSLIESITFNPDVEHNQDRECTTVDGRTSCMVTLTGYPGGTYTLEVEIDTAQYDHYRDIWNVDLEISEQYVDVPTLMRHDSDATKTFGKSIARDSFESITTVDNITVPNTAIDSWDVSDEQDETVIAWYTDSDNDNLYELYIGEVGGVKANSNSSYTFSYFKKVATIDLTNFDTKYATDMGYMFYYAGFSATSFTTDVSNFNTSNVTTLWHMFDGCGYNSTSWSIGNLDDWNTSNVTKMISVFESSGYNSTTWSVGDLSDWDTSKVTSFAGMFESAGYSVTTTVDISYIENWDTSSALYMQFMFENTGRNAATVNFGDLSNWDTSHVLDMYYMFYFAAHNATSLDVSFVSGWDVSSVRDMHNMFGYLGYNATSVTFGDVSDWDTSHVTRMDYMFSGAFAASSDVDITSISSWDVSNVTMMTGMFYACAGNVENFSLDLTDWDVSNVEGFGGMFELIGYNAVNFSLDVSTWDTGNGLYMQKMFYQAGYSADTWSISNLSNWDVSNAQNMSEMFSYTCLFANTCNFGNLGNWNTKNATNMYGMFSISGEYASTWYIGDLSGWNVSKVTDMSYMFHDTGYEATTWNIGNLSNWDTRKVTSMNSMFYLAGKEAGTWNSIGTFKIYATSIKDMFHDSPLANCTLNIYNRPSAYGAIFSGAATSGSGITVNYTSSVTNIDSIISNKSAGSTITKGTQIS